MKHRIIRGGACIGLFLTSVYLESSNEITVGRCPIQQAFDNLFLEKNLQESISLILPAIKNDEQFTLETQNTLRILASLEDNTALNLLKKTLQAKTSLKNLSSFFKKKEAAAAQAENIDPIAIINFIITIAKKKRTPQLLIYEEITDFFKKLVTTLENKDFSEFKAYPERAAQLFKALPSPQRSNSKKKFSELDLLFLNSEERNFLESALESDIEKEIPEIIKPFVNALPIKIDACKKAAQELLKKDEEYHAYSEHVYRQILILHALADRHEKPAPKIGIPIDFAIAPSVPLRPALCTICQHPLECVHCKTKEEETSDAKKFDQTESSDEKKFNDESNNIPSIPAQTEKPKISIILKNFFCTLTSSLKSLYDFLTFFLK